MREDSERTCHSDDPQGHTDYSKLVSVLESRATGTRENGWPHTPCHQCEMSEAPIAFHSHAGRPCERHHTGRERARGSPGKRITVTQALPSGSTSTLPSCSCTERAGDSSHNSLESHEPAAGMQPWPAVTKFTIHDWPLLGRTDAAALLVTDMSGLIGFARSKRCSD